MVLPLHSEWPWGASVPAKYTLHHGAGRRAPAVSDALTRGGIRLTMRKGRNTIYMKIVIKIY
jgi:hypothetical protein